MNLLSDLNPHFKSCDVSPIFKYNPFQIILLLEDVALKHRFHGDKFN